MKAYKAVWADLERGRIIRFFSSKRAANTCIAHWKRIHKFRELEWVKQVEIPDNKKDLLEWLNMVMEP